VRIIHKEENDTLRQSLAIEAGEVAYNVPQHQRQLAPVVSENCSAGTGQQIVTCGNCALAEAAKMVQGVEQMGKTFNSITFNGITAQHGVESPNLKPKRTDSEYEPNFGSKAYFAKRADTCFTRKTLHRKLPVTEWLPRYSKLDFIADLIAGITVGFTIIPQSIAFSELANLPAEYGLYSGYIGSLVYIFLGTTKEITIGPAAVICILIGGATHGASSAYTVALSTILCLFSGIFCLGLSFLKLGVIVEFISAPVVAGFVSAAAIMIVASQVKTILGLTGIHGEDLVSLMRGVYYKIGETNLSDLTMALCGIAVLIFLQEMKRLPLYKCVAPSRRKTFVHAITIISAARNALMIPACGLIAYFWNTAADNTGRISMTEPVSVIGLPRFQPPPLYLPEVNETIHGKLQTFPAKSFMEIMRESGTIVAVIPLICVVEQIAVCKTFAKVRPVDVNQELVSLGASQLVASFFQSMPVTGSICRSCVNAVSGVRTPFGGIWSGMIVISALLFFTPYLKYIPKPALAAIVVCAVVHMIEYEEAIHIWRTKKRDMVPLVTTFICCLFVGLEWGFLIGVVVNLLMVLTHAANPGVSSTKFGLSSDITVVILRPDRALLYPGIAKVRNLISKKALKNQDAVIVVDCVHLISIDFTGAKGLGSVASALMDRGQKIIFVNVSVKIEAALRGFTHDHIEIYETAQQWIETLKDVADRKLIVRSMSNIDDMEHKAHHPRGQHPGSSLGEKKSASFTQGDHQFGDGDVSHCSTVCDSEATVDVPVVKIH
jgi:sodium-independent sulfate anion transporter 11